MFFRRVINKIRYNFWFSSLFELLTFPFYHLCRYAVSVIKRKVKINGKPVKFYGFTLAFPPNVGVNINSKIFWSQEQDFEPLTSKILLVFFGTCDVFFDIGSNFGFYSVLAQKANDSIAVKCFEPLPNIYRDNLAFHRINRSERQQVYNVGVSATTDEVTFYVPDVYAVDSEITSSSIEKDFLYNQKFPQTEIKIKTMTLDSFVEKEPDLKRKKVILKIDVEGHELHVLQGATRFLKELRPFIIMEIEKRPDNFKSIYELLDLMQYALYAIDNSGVFRLSLDEIAEFVGGNDFLLLPMEKVAGNYISLKTLNGL
jgi:FkbM family methyltransferase